MKRFVALVAVILAARLFANGGRLSAGLAFAFHVGNGDMPFSYRCSRCSLNWPNQSKFKNCPGCGEETSLLSNETPLPLPEAMSKAKHLAFERLYDERERARSGPSPEELGREEARVLVDLDRALNGEG